MTLSKASYDFVIVGGGIIGLSTAWQIARRAVGSVLLVEQNNLTSGTTWHAAGLIGSHKLSKPIYEMAQVSRDLYRELEAESGVGWHHTGSLGIARNEDELRMLQHMKQLGQFCSHRSGREDRARMVSPAEVAHLHPFLDTSGIVGGIYTDKQDGVVNPSDAAMAIAARARSEGVTIMEHTAVTAFDLNCNTSKVDSLTCETPEQGLLHVSCDKVILTAGAWTKQLVELLIGRKALPVGIVPHQYVVFDSLDGVNYSLPVVRDYQNKFYLKPEAGGCFALGIFEEHPERHMPAVVRERNAKAFVPRDACSELYEGDLEKMETIGNIMGLVPALSEVGIKSWVHGPDTHSADHSPVMGQLHETQNVYVATGFNSQGIQCGAGAGLAMAEWILDGHPQSFATDFTACDVVRFSPDLAQRDDIVVARAMESYGTLFQTHYPFEQMEHRRGEMRTLPLHDKHVQQNAVFAEAYGWERPAYYLEDKNAMLDQHKKAGRLLVPSNYGYEKKRTEAYESERRESIQCRERAVIFDLSPFGKLCIKGRDALVLLERMCTNRMDKPSGSVTYSFMLNDKGGILADFTVCRLAEDEFYVVTLADQHNMLESRIKEFAMRHELAVQVDNQTLDRSVFGVMGPDSSTILTRALESDFSNKAFPEYTAQHIKIPGINAQALALRVSFVGTLGWELHVLNDAAAAVFDGVFQAAQELNVEGFQCAGTYALMESLRMEKKFIHYGHDVSPLETPLDVGMKFACKLGDEDFDFVGKEALLAQTPTKMFVTVIPNEQDRSKMSIWGLGSELLYRNGELVGFITSGGHSHTADLPFGLALVDSFKLNNEQDRYELELPTRNGVVERFPVTLTKKSLLDYYRT